MAKKIHLDSIERPEGTIWFTLVMENDKEFFVEKTIDTKLPTLKNKVEKIPPSDFSKHIVNGKSLTTLIAERIN
jgi:hypothetical protein